MPAMICRFVKRTHMLPILSGILAAGRARFRVPMQDQSVTEKPITEELFYRSEGFNKRTRT